MWSESQDFVDSGRSAGGADPKIRTKAAKPPKHSGKFSLDARAQRLDESHEKSAGNLIVESTHQKMSLSRSSYTPKPTKSTSKDSKFKSNDQSKGHKRSMKSLKPPRRSSVQYNKGTSWSRSDSKSSNFSKSNSKQPKLERTTSESKSKFAKTSPKSTLSSLHSLKKSKIVPLPYMRKTEEQFKTLLIPLGLVSYNNCLGDVNKYS